tara:strand:- start:268 stop:1344 length:1077 start_codon:yes stop_codon:yes gene_type:complete
MKKNFLITTGGSGGHVVPATILYDHLSKVANIIITTDKRGLKYLDKEFYKFKIIDTPRLNNIFLLPLNLIIILILTFRSFFLLKNNKIEKVFSTGGYMSLPLILSARLLNLNIYLIEPNQVLGRANRFFLDYCKKIFCYSDKIKNFPDNLINKMCIINPLVRKNIYKKDTSRVNDKFTILVVGGSQSANIFDRKLKDVIVKISKKKSIKIIQQTNKKNISFLKDFYLKYNVENKIFTYNKNFVDIIKHVDLCITRAGASILAELSLVNIPFIAVPLPTSKDNHQLENAKFYNENDCCWLIEQINFEERIGDLLNKILTNNSEYLLKKENLKKLNYQNSWISVNQKILKILNENRVSKN